MSIQIKYKAALVGCSGLIAVGMLQGCATTSGSLDGASAAFSRSPTVDESAPQTIKPLEERSPRGDKNATSSSKGSPKRNVGQASWYGPGFHGKKTANGEIFDDKKFTAAHKTLPLGTKAKITNLHNQKSVEVVINDRGPYVKGRIIDLSKAAAKALDIVDQGTAEVRVEVLNE